ncbi:DNA polymerase III subunit delta', partial [Leucobacter sp. M11]|nr:DNA polymerase III subunit delta' [Leucobacter sp. M11]
LVTPATADVAALLVRRDGRDPEAAERAARLAQSHIGMARRLAADPVALERRQRTVELVLGVAGLGGAMRVAAELSELAGEDAKAITVERDAREREEALRNLGVAPGQAVPPGLRSQVKTLEENQKRRATRSLRDGIDRILTDLLSLFRDILLTQLGAGDALVNREFSDRIRARADAGTPEGTLATIDALTEARDRIARNVTPGLALEAFLATAALNSSEDR